MLAVLMALAIATPVSVQFNADNRPAIRQSLARADDIDDGGDPVIAAIFAGVLIWTGGMIFKGILNGPNLLTGVGYSVSQDQNLRLLGFQDGDKLIIDRDGKKAKIIKKNGSSIDLSKSKRDGLWKILAAVERGNSSRVLAEEAIVQRALKGTQDESANKNVLGKSANLAI
ncbi:MAG: hypothetical protein ACXWP5_00925 [Bdellovibrionota bacterium]